MRENEILWVTMFWFMGIGKSQHFLSEIRNIRFSDRRVFILLTDAYNVMSFRWCFANSNIFLNVFSSDAALGFGT